MTVPEFFEPSGAFLYHYTTLGTALERIVPAQSLRLGPFSAMRDPRESHDWYIGGTGYGGTRDDIQKWIEFNRAMQDLKSRVNVLSLTHDDPVGRDTTSADFSWGFAHQRLWEHYADNHRGVCLCFSADALHDRLMHRLSGYGDLHCGAVSYVDAEIAPEALYVLLEELRSHGATEAAANHVRANLTELFFTKLKDWETEREYRYVVVTEDREPVYANVSPALHAVILGADDGSRFYEPAFAKLCDPGGVEIFHMRWIHGRPHIAPRFDPLETARD